MNRKKEDHKVLDELANELAINHLRHSFLSSEVTDRIDYREDILGKDFPSPNLTRTIFIVGAGASTNASYNVFPPGLGAIQLIEQYFDINKWPKEILDKSNKIKSLVNLPKIDVSNDFETRLSTLSHFLKDADVQEAIKHIYNHRTFPNLFYEILAHLLKNRYIDGIINFNFDELLDQTVEEEVGMGQLHKIVSDGDCLDYTDLLVDNKLKVPFYIKPHGTISHKSSLLFTKEHYINISSDIENLLEEIMTGQPLSGNQIDKQFDQLNIVTAGFQLESIEFNRVLQRSIDYLSEVGIKVKIIYLSYSSDEEKCSKISSNLEKMFDNKVVVKTLILKNFNISSSRSTGLEPYLDGRYLDHFGLNLIDASVKSFKPEYFPGDINRHIGLVSFFQKEISDVNNKYRYDDFIKDSCEDFLSRKRDMFFETKEYYLERTIFEIINVVLKNNGRIQPKESLKGVNRVGIYFNLYVRKHRKFYADNNENLSSESVSNELSFYDILDALNLESSISKNSKEVFTREKEDFIRSSFIKIMSSWISSVEKLATNDFYRKHAHQKELLSLCVKSLLKFKFVHEQIFFYTTKDKKRQNKLNAGDSLLTSQSISLYPNYNDVQLNIISKIDSKNIVATNLALTYRYKSMFLDTNNHWTRLHIISDRGIATLRVLEDVISNKVKFKVHRTIYAVLSDMRLSENLISLSEQIDNLELKIFQLPTYDHSRHMALFTGECLKFSKVIYYYKKGYSNNINAVHLEGRSNRSNLNMLYQNFKQYVAKAIVFAAKGNSESKSNGLRYLPHFSCKGQIDDIIEGADINLLDDLDKEHLKNFNAYEINP